MGKKGLRMDLAEQCGEVPRAALTGGSIFHPGEAGIPNGSASTFVSPGPGAKGQRTTANQGKKKFNLRGIVEVLEEYELDPTAEIAKALRATKRGRNAEGEEINVPVIDADTRAKISLALLEYVQPKLKSVEVKHTGPELTDEQIDKRIEALIGKKNA